MKWSAPPAKRVIWGSRIPMVDILTDWSITVDDDVLMVLKMIILALS